MRQNPPMRVLSVYFLNSIGAKSKAESTQVKKKKKKSLFQRGGLPGAPAAAEKQREENGPNFCKMETSLFSDQTSPETVGTLCEEPFFF